MFRMEIDSSPESNNLSTQDRILQRLSLLGIPEENLKELQPGLVAYVKNNKFLLPELVSAILPTNEEVIEAISESQEESTRTMFGSNVEDIFHESMIWLQWLMFEGDPSVALEQLAEMNSHRGVCGAVWGNNDIAYRCRTCEHDPTCAICVPCFQNGNHKDHDYSIIYTGGGCCDCGDVTAWKREGFCSRHKGAEQIRPLPEEFAKSLGPVLDSSLLCWEKKLLFARSISEESAQVDDHLVELKNVADELTSAVVEMLLEFCKHSESLLSFISQRVFSSVGLLDVLVRAERFLNEDVVRKLHELLLKFLGEPQFKYEFAKVFLSYYPTVVKEATKDSSDAVSRKYSLLSTFSVQILTVPTLTPRLVKEMNLLAILFECLDDIFISCAGEDGRLQVSKWGNLYETTLRVVEDIRFVMSHSDVPKYVTHDRRDLSRTWMKLLAFVQGMNPQKRETGIHVEEENENMHLPFVLGHSIANIHSLIVAGAFSGSIDVETDEEALNMYRQEFEDQDSVRHAKVGRISQESSVSSMTGRSAFDHASKSLEMKYENIPLQTSVVWLTFECLRALENWLQVDNTSGPLVSVLSPKTSHSSGNNFFAFRRTLSKFRRGRHIFRSYGAPSNGRASGDFSGKQLPSSANGSNVGIDSESDRSYVQESVLGGSDDNGQEGEYASELEALRVLSLSDWPDIVYDVSSQEISVHIPLHRLLSMILQSALKKCYGESTLPIATSPSHSDPLSATHHDFFGHILGGCHPHGFSAFLMEHPLRIRVFCAEVHAGMWRRNGDAAILSCEWYRSVRWSEQGLEFDLFLLQCCAALAPADFYAQRILERFGLSNYLSLNVERSSEYEPILVQEMLTLIIQIIKERRFSGLDTAECLQRELIYTLSIGDATHSQLVKSLPRDLSKFNKLQEILDTIADYSNPSGMNQGMYKLRLQYWKELDLYHPRWNPRDLQVAEERYLRFCNISALTNQLPKWTRIYHPLRGIARIATCKTIVQIVRAVLFYAVFTERSTASRAPDGVLIAAMHLLSLALDICCVQKESGDRLCYVDDVIPILAFAGEEICTNRYGDQSMLSLLVLLMRIHQKQSVDNLREAGNFNLSSLIENILKKFAELEPECMAKLQKHAPEIVSQLSQSAKEVEVNGMALASDVDKRKAKARERQAAIMEKMRAQQSKFLASIDSSLDDEMDVKKIGEEATDSNVEHISEESTQVICSLCHDLSSKGPVSYLILLQKSRLLSFVDRAPPAWDQVRCSGKELASTSSNTFKVSSRRSREVASSPEMLHLVQSAVNQIAVDGEPGEVKASLEYIKVRFPSLKNVHLPCTASSSKEKTSSSLESLEEHMHKMIREGMQNHSLHLDFVDNVDKISSCGGSKAAESATESLFLGKYIAALSKETLENASGSENSLSLDGNSRSESSTLLPVSDGIGPSDCDGIYLTSCGHAVHQGCLDRYLSSLKERYMRRIVFEGGHIVDPDQGEFLCPVCRGLSNSVLPALSGNSRRVSSSPFVSNNSQSDAAGSLSFLNREGNLLHFEEALSLLRSAAEVAGRDEILRALPLQRFGKIKLHLEPVFRVLCEMYFPSKDKVSGSGGVNQSIILWDTLKYSLISTEIAARSRKSSLIPSYSLTALYKELKSSNCFILSLLLNIVQSMRTTNSLSSLLRLKGVKLFAHSICSGVSLDKLPNPSSVEGGYLQQILEHCGTEAQCREIQLWTRASDPIIARDPFSSLMWILFCLPSPFVMCKDSFLSLVHLLYVVATTQATITYCRKRGLSSAESGYQDCLIADIYKFMEEYEVAAQYFESSCIDTSYDLKDAIRSLCFPFLRRCALLWKLINSSTSAPFSDGTQVSDGSLWVGADGMEFTTTDVEEITEVEKFEKIFKIPPFDVVITNRLSRSIVSRWLRHFSEELEARALPRVLYFTPAVPFKLMLLPHLYQDVLQRYIKQRCPDCGGIQDEPALCLICGKLCSPNWKTCCRESGCQNHAIICGAGAGVFLLIRKTTVLLQRSARQAPWPSPYLDAFGEEDIDMKRGKPLYLNEERYAALTHMVASHGLDRSSKVLRQTTIGAFFML